MIELAKLNSEHTDQKSSLESVMKMEKMDVNNTDVSVII